jgi:hypothetical protein
MKSCFVKDDLFDMCSESSGSFLPSRLHRQTIASSSPFPSRPTAMHQSLTRSSTTGLAKSVQPSTLSQPDNLRTAPSLPLSHPSISTISSFSISNPSASASAFAAKCAGSRAPTTGVHPFCKLYRMSICAGDFAYLAANAFRRGWSAYVFRASAVCACT